MSSGFPQTQAPRKGGGMFFILIFVGIAIFMFSQNAGDRGNQRQPPNQQGSDINIDIDGDFDLDVDKDRRASSPKQNRTQQGDWGMEDVATSTNQPDTPPKKKSSSVQQGDWGMEEVEVKKEKKNQFQFSDDQTKGAPQPAGSKQPTKTQQGDWGLEEVDTKSSEPVKSPAKKTQKGDWGLEEVGSGKGN